MLLRVKPITIFFFLTCVLNTSIVFSQVKDNKTKSIRIPVEPSKKDKDSTLKKIKVAPKLADEVAKNNNVSKNTSESLKKYSLKE